jgi:hypothetical protein
MLGAILILLVIIVGLLLFIALKHYQLPRIKKKSVITEAYSTQRVQIQSPLQALSFEEVLSLTPLYENMKFFAEENLRVQVNTSLGIDALATGANAICYVRERGTYIIKFKEEAQKLLNADHIEFMRDAQGQRIPTLVKDGKIITNARLVNGQKFLSTASQLGSVVVGAAHMISAADMAKKLKIVSKDLKYLIQIHKNEQLGRLESIFKHAQELTALPRTPETNIALLDLSKELHELRSTWRRDTNYNLSNIEDPEKGNWFERKFRRTKTDKYIADGISDSIADLRYIEVSIAIHMSLFYTIGAPDIFFTVSLPNELKQFAETFELLKQKRSYLSAKDPEWSAESTIEYFKTFLERYHALSPLSSTASPNMLTSAV